MITRVIEASDYDTFNYRVKLGANKLETETKALCLFQANEALETNLVKAKVVAPPGSTTGIKLENFIVAVHSYLLQLLLAACSWSNTQIGLVEAYVACMSGLVWELFELVHCQRHYCPSVLAVIADFY